MAHGRTEATSKISRQPPIQIFYFQETCKDHHLQRPFTTIITLFESLPCVSTIPFQVFTLQ